MKGPMEALTYPNGEYAVSNDAARYLAEDAMVSSGRWRAVDDTAEAQQLANKGVVVVGVQRGALDEHGQRKHGHMVTVRPEQMPGFAEMTPFYRRDSRNLAVLVPDAWRRVLAESPPPPPLSGGEVWDGPHGYYAGDWYQMGAYEERIAYLAAYLWCLRTYGKQSATAYPRSLDYYDQRIWNYVETRKAYYEPAAEILARFRSAVPN